MVHVAAFSLISDIEQIPSGVQAQVRKGFTVASALPSEDITKIVGFVIRQVADEGANFDNETLSKQFNIPPNEATPLFMALAVTIGLLADSPASVDEFVEAGRGKLFEDAAEALASSIAQLVVPQQSRLKSSISRQQLAGAVIPSLRSFTSAVDLRIRFDNGKLEEYVGVAVVHIDTDIDGNQLTLQLTKQDVNGIIEKLQEVSKQIDQAESLIKNIKD